MVKEEEEDAHVDAGLPKQGQASPLEPIKESKRVRRTERG